MFESLRNLFRDLTSDNAESRSFDETDHRLAATALLIHVADADGAYEDKEIQRIGKVVADRFGLDSATAARLVEEALKSDHEAVGIDHFVNVLKRVLDADGRLKLIEMMWDIVYADGDATETEESIIWRIAGMLGVSETDRETLRRARAPGNWPAASGPGGEE